MSSKALLVLPLFLANLVVLAQSTHQESLNTSYENFSTSNLPILIVQTDGQNIPDEPKITAKLKLIANDGSRNEITDKPAFTGSVGIELRGNSTQKFPKKPYNIEIRDKMGEDFAIELLGMPKESDWVLRASYIDHTFIRNPLAMYMSRSMGHWASRCRFVELMLNDDYQGIYILMEKIKRDKNRVDINKLKEDEVAGEDLTGGYIYEVTGRGADLGKKRDLRYPKMSAAAPEQIDYITRYDDNFRAVMSSAAFADKQIGYHSIIEPSTFIDEMLVQEAMRNSDAYGWSSYFHKDKAGKLMAGPVWDFDQSGGNSSYPDDGVIEGWMFAHTSTSNTPFFWKKLYSDPYFAFALRERWENLRQDVFSNESLFGYIDSLAGLLEEAQVREFDRWPVLGTNFWRETKGYKERDTFEKEVAYLKGFLADRWKWMDSTLAKIENPDHTSPTKNFEILSLKVFPNPASTHISFTLPRPTPQASLSLYNSSLQKINQLELSQQGADLLNWSVDKLPSGLYFYQYRDGATLAAGKFLVQHP